jgi:NADH-quinone oxidoreductase subunit C
MEKRGMKGAGRDWVRNLGRVYKSGRDAVFVEAKRSGFSKAIKAIHEKTSRISTITGYDSGKDIELIYHFPVGRRLVNLKVRIKRGKPRIETITKLFPGAELFERELHDLVGVHVAGHPNLERILLDATSPGAPLRKRVGRKAL